jgi:hypothetical protein
VCVSDDVRLTLVPPPPADLPADVEVASAPALITRRELRQRRVSLEDQLAERRWFMRVMLLFVALSVGMLGLTGWLTMSSLRTGDRDVRTALAQVHDAERVLRDIQVVESHAASHPESYLILQRHRDVIRHRREQYNAAVTRYNCTSALHYSKWVHQWLRLPRRHAYLSLAD